MPYILVEHSANLAPEINIMALLTEVHSAAIRTGLFDPAATRTRAVRRDHVVMGDGDPTNAFVLITARIRKGRDDIARRNLAEVLLQAASECLEAAFNGRSMALNVEVQEIDAIGVRRHDLRRAIVSPIGTTGI